jgi:hypothetical protein
MIQESTYVRGCVAWFTDPVLVEALRSKKGVQMIVHEKDKRSAFSSWAPFDRNQPDQIWKEWKTSHLSSTKQKKGQPFMHHKFLIFYNESKFPYAVWFGTFNFTLTACRSFESACIYFHSQIAKHFELEFQSIWESHSIVEDNNHEKKEKTSSSHLSSSS